MDINSALNLIQEELERAIRKHGFWPKDLIHQAAIIGEESGEILQAALDYIYFGGNIKQIDLEVIQTAAMCLRFLLNRTHI